MKKVLYVGIDVDDKAFHGAGFCEKTGELLEFSCKPTNGALLGKLSKLKEKGFKLKTCYEATYIGYSLHRFLESRGVDNTIIAPSLSGRSRELHPQPPSEPYVIVSHHTAPMTFTFPDGSLNIINVMEISKHEY